MIQRILNNSYTILIARLVLGTIFVMYGVDKIIAPKDFAHNILNYKMLPEVVVNIFALTLPWLETICGVLLILGVRLRANAILSGAMTLMFMGAVSIAMIRGLEINCGCSAHAETVGWPKLMEDTGYLLLALLIYLFPRKEFTLEYYVTSLQQEPTVTA
ncbi:MAG: MauE/DoxX family redox-associated membrane protein [Candidatus Kapaibacterium sp.]